MSKKIYSPLIQDPLTKKYYRQELKLHEGIVLTGQQQFISDLIKQRDDCKTQRDSLIDDIAVLRANNERLERELEIINKHENGLVSTIKLKDELLKESGEKIAELERENEKLKTTNENLNNRVCNLNLTAQIEHDDLMSCDGEVRYWKDKYTTLTDHIRDMRSDMLKTYENYEVQKHINKDEGIHKILEGAQISLAVVLDELSKIDELERADDER